MCEEVGFEIGKELSARHGQKRLDLERGARIWSLEEPKRWGDGFPKPWNEVMETAVGQFSFDSWGTTEC